MARDSRDRKDRRNDFENVSHAEEVWNPRTELGILVKEGKISNIDEILDQGKKILEAKITDVLLPGLEVVQLEIGQSKGKFGGGKKSIWKTTQRVTEEGSVPKFASGVVLGDKNGHVGIGFGDSNETLPAKEKAYRNARLSIIKVTRGCGSWECGCGSKHSIPFKVTGKAGSVVINLSPAPKGSGLVAPEQAKKVLQLAGIKDVYSECFGQTRTKMNVVKATYDALKKLSTYKLTEGFKKSSGLSEE